MDIIGCLPPEISQQILLYLRSEDIDVVWNCIEDWKHIIFNNSFWKKVCRRNNYQENEECLSSNIYSECMLKHSLRWQAIYTYNRLIQSNWRSDNYENVSITENKKYSGILWFDDQTLIASLYSIDNIAIDIINLSTGNIYFNFNEKKPVKAMIRHQNLLIYFVSRTLKVLNLETKSWILKLRLEISRLYPEEIYMKVYNNLLAVLNPLYCCYIINLETKKLNFKLLDVLDGCFGDNVIIVALRRGKKLQVLDLNGKPLISITYGGGLKVEYILTKGAYVIISYCKIAEQRHQNVSLYTIHLETKSLQKIKTIKVFYQLVAFPNENTMLFWNLKGRKTGTYKIWRFTMENSYVTFDYNETKLATTKANNRYLFLYTEDSILNMRCLKTGKFIKDITRKDMALFFAENFQVTERKFAYINSESCLRILNYDFIPK